MSLQKTRLPPFSSSRIGEIAEVSPRPSSALERVDSCGPKATSGAFFGVVLRGNTLLGARPGGVDGDAGTEGEIEGAVDMREATESGLDHKERIPVFGFSRAVPLSFLVLSVVGRRRRRSHRGGCIL